MVIATIAFALIAGFSGWRAVVHSDERRDVQVLLYLVIFWVFFVLTVVLLLVQNGMQHA